MKTRIIIALLIAIITNLSATVETQASTINGNDICLYLAEALEAKDKEELKFQMEEADGKNMYFRYLLVLKMEPGNEGGRPYIDMEVKEPSSYYRLKFRVKKNVSLVRLLQDPETGVGDYIAITTRFAKLDEKKKTADCAPVIIRHKDRADPKVGKEMLGELIKESQYYMLTGVPGKKVSVSFEDRDLIDNNKDKLMAAKRSPEAKEAWADFLIAEVAKRKAAKAKRIMQIKINAGLIKGEGAGKPVLEER